MEKHEETRYCNIEFSADSVREKPSYYRDFGFVAYCVKHVLDNSSHVVLIVCLSQRQSLMNSMKELDQSCFLKEREWQQ